MIPPVRSVVLLSALFMAILVLVGLSLSPINGATGPARALDPQPTVDTAGGPPPGGGQDPDAPIIEQIAQVLWNARQNGQIAGEQDLRPLIEQLHPDLQVTLGGGPVGGTTRLSHISGSQLGQDGSAGANTPRLARMVASSFGVLMLLGGLGWYAIKRIVPRRNE